VFGGNEQSKCTLGTNEHPQAFALDPTFQAVPAVFLMLYVNCILVMAF